MSGSPPTSSSRVGILAMLGVATLLPACQKKLSGTQAAANIKDVAAPTIELASVTCPPSIDKPREKFTCAVVDKGGTTANLTVHYDDGNLTPLTWEPDTPYSQAGKLAAELKPRLKEKYGTDYNVNCNPSGYFVKVGVKVRCTATAGAEHGVITANDTTVTGDTSSLFDYEENWK